MSNEVELAGKVFGAKTSPITKDNVRSVTVSTNNPFTAVVEFTVAVELDMKTAQQLVNLLIKGENK